MTGHATNATLPAIVPCDVYEFLAAVVPANHWLCFARHRSDPDYGQPKLAWQHIWVGPDAKQLLTKTIERMHGESSTNWYFAVSGYTNAKRRTVEEVRAIKTLLLDVDIGKGAGFLPSKVAVFSQLRDLHNACPGLPKPWIVDSGNGIHIYYPLDRDLTVVEWAPLAALFAEVVKTVAPGLIADPVRTRDAASVMRMPTSWNAKQSSRLPVRVLSGGEPGTVNDVKGTLAAAAVTHNLSGVEAVIGNKLVMNLPSLPSYMHGVGETATFGQGLDGKEYNFTDLNLKPIVAGCKQMREILMVKGNVPEPLWVLYLRVLSTVKNAEDVAIEFSSGHPTSSPAATRRKLRHVMQHYAAPTAGCKEFKLLNPKACYNCLHNKQVWTPSQLAVMHEQAIVMDAAKAEAVESAVAGAVTPAGYLPQPHGSRQSLTAPSNYEVTVLPVRQPGKDGGYEPEPVIRAHLNLIRSTAKMDAIVVDGEETTKLNDIRIHLDVTAQGRTSHAACSIDDLTSSAFDKCTATLRNMGVVFGLGQAKHNAAQEYLHDLVNASAHRRDLYRPVKGWMRTGYKGDWSFVAGTRHYLPDGTTEDNVSSAEHAGLARRNEGFMERCMSGQPVGRLTLWQKAMQVYNGKGLEAAQLLLLSGLSNLLMPLVASEKGGILLSLTGGSGKGKTTLLKFMASFMGDHRRYILPGASTSNALGMLLQQATCMMLPVDDTMTTDGEVFSTLLTMVTGGAEKMRMTWDAKTGGSVPYDEGFSASLLLTSNYSTSAAIGMSRRQGGEQLQTEAARTRTLEFPATDIVNELISKEEWDRSTEVLAANHGHAVDLFLKYVVKHQRAVADACQKLESEIAARIRQRLEKPKSGQVRFWARFLAVNGVTAEIVCKKLNLLPWDHKAILAAGESLVEATVEEDHVDDSTLVDTFWKLCGEEPNPNVPSINHVMREAAEVQWPFWKTSSRLERMLKSHWPDPGATGTPAGGMQVGSAANDVRWRLDTFDIYEQVGGVKTVKFRERAVQIPLNELRHLISQATGKRLAVTDWVDLHSRLAAAGCVIIGVSEKNPSKLQRPPLRSILGMTKFQPRGPTTAVVEIRLPPQSIS